MSANQQQTQPNAPMKVYRRMLQFAKPYTGILLLGIFASVLLSGIDAGISWMVKPIVDQGFIDKNRMLIQWLPLLLVGVFVLRGFAGFISIYFISRAGRNVIMDFRRKIFEKLLVLPAYFYDKHASGKLLSMVIYNVTEVTNATTDILLVILREGLMIVGSVVVMFVISWQLSLIFLSAVPIIVWLVNYSSRRIRRISKSVQEVVGEMAHVAEENIESYKTVRLFGSQRYEKNRFYEMTHKNRQLDLKVIVTNALNTALVQVFIALPIAFAIYLATLQTSAITAGGFVAVIVTMIRILQPMRRLTRVNTQLQVGIANANRIFELLAEAPEKDTGKTNLPNVKGDIVFNGVSFAYPGTERHILHDVSFNIKPGQTVALVGQSGAGKSTLANLLLRFYPDYQGEILLDGQAITGYPLADYRTEIAYVSQHVALFDDTIEKNIAYGHVGGNLEAVGEADIIRVAKAAHVMEFVQRFPRGMQTVIGENGVRLSGGQRQRIAIARALLKKAKILVLDEATSSLDTVAEKHIQAALDELMQERTTLVIAHRLSTIESADCILVLDQGRVVESGTHAELLKRSGHYAALYAMQFKDQKKPEGKATNAQKTAPAMVPA